MKFCYYPGCSLKGTGRAYEESLLAVFRELGAELHELDDWNCCGATAYMSVDEVMACTLTARNIALAARSGLQQMLAPCSACYLALNKTKHAIAESPEIAQRVDEALGRAGLTYQNGVAVRHPLDVLVNDVGLDAIRQKVRRSLKGIKVAPYYGCQIVRPYATFDDSFRPMTLDRLVQALGAEVQRFPLKTKCCGGSLTGTMAEIGMRLSFLILREAAKRGADVVVTVCPLCQFNLEAYQTEMPRDWEPVRMPVLHFTQLIGIALGLEPKALGLQRAIVSLKPLLERLALQEAPV
jgi:heterodisulfide reductase subunit B